MSDDSILYSLGRDPDPPARQTAGGGPEAFAPYLPAGEKDRFKDACAIRGETMSRALARMIRGYIAEINPPKEDR